MEDMYLTWLNTEIEHLKQVATYKHYPHNIVFEERAIQLEYARQNYINCLELENEQHDSKTME